MSEELKINLQARIGEVPSDIKQKFDNFYIALEELPTHLPIELNLNGKDYTGGVNLNVGKLIVESVKQHFAIEQQKD